MTAIVGVLNKHGVALAADSAVTVNTPKGRKILNSANKIIRLSKRHPVGVMMYSSASFLTTPWDVLIKMYRDEKKEVSCETVQQYEDDFVGFLKRNNYFSSEEVQKNIFSVYISTLYNDIKALALRQIGSSVTDKNKVYLYQIMEKQMEDIGSKLLSLSRCPDFSDYSMVSFREDYGDLINDIVLPQVNDSVDKSQHVNSVLEFIYSTVVSSQFLGSYSGLVFVGYGAKEIYPSLIPIKVSLVVSGRLKYAIDEDNIAVIGDGPDQHSASIRPFAQIDVINTILRGVDDSIYSLFSNILNDSLEQFKITISKAISELPNLGKELEEAIVNLDVSKIRDYANNKMNEYIVNNNVRQLMSTIEYLDKEDLALMAESLISLTSLKRRMMSSEESVGGPVDVAVISKGDGFVWIKRKMYFDKAINQQYFEIYNK